MDSEQGDFNKLKNNENNITGIEITNTTNIM